MVMINFLIVSLFLQGALGDLVCEKLPIEKCAFSISSSGKRCLLETYTIGEDYLNYQCETSEIIVNYIPGWIESEKCITECGVDRYSIGIASDSLMEPGFIAKLCANACYQNCPNIIDLYYNLALVEGAFLPNMCDVQYNPHRMMSQISSSGVASGPPSAHSDIVFANSPTNPKKLNHMIDPNSQVIVRHVFSV